MSASPVKKIMRWAADRRSLLIEELTAPAIIESVLDQLGQNDDFVEYGLPVDEQDRRLWIAAIENKNVYMNAIYRKKDGRSKELVGADYHVRKTESFVKDGTLYIVPDVYEYTIFLKSEFRAINGPDANGSRIKHGLNLPYFLLAAFDALNFWKRKQIVGCVIPTGNEQRLSYAYGIIGDRIRANRAKLKALPMIKGTRVEYILDNDPGFSLESFILFKEADIFDSTLAFIGLTRQEVQALAKQDSPNEKAVGKLAEMWIQNDLMEYMGIAPTEGTKFLLFFPPNTDRATYLIPSRVFAERTLSAGAH